MKHILFFLFIVICSNCFANSEYEYVKTKDKITLRTYVGGQESEEDSKKLDSLLMALASVIDRKGNNVPIKIYWGIIPVYSFDLFSCQSSVVLSYDTMKEIDLFFIDDYLMFHTSEKSKDLFIDLNSRYISKYRLKKLKKLQDGAVDIKSSYYNNKGDAAIFVILNNGICPTNKKTFDELLHNTFEKLYSIVQYAIDNFDYIKNNQQKIDFNWTVEFYEYLKDFHTNVSINSIDTNLVKNIPEKHISVPFAQLIINKKKDYNLISLRIIGISILIISLFCFILHKISSTR